jgi:hypothetical protein
MIYKQNGDENTTPSRWNQPLADYDVKSFYQNYMPWLNATSYALRKEQYLKQQQQ